MQDTGQGEAQPCGCLLHEETGLDTQGVEVVMSNLGSLPQLPAPAAQSYYANEVLPHPGLVPFRVSRTHFSPPLLMVPLDFMQNKPPPCGFWAKETSGRSEELAMLFPVCMLCVRV